MSKQYKSFPARLYRRYIENLTKSLIERLEKQPLWAIHQESSDRCLLIYESATGLLWDANPDKENRLDTVSANNAVIACEKADLKGWRMPDDDELKWFAKTAKNPMSEKLLKLVNWFSSRGIVDLDSSGFSNRFGNRFSIHLSAYLLPCHSLLIDKDKVELINQAIQRGWRICSYSEPGDILPIEMITGEPDIVSLYQDVDYISTRLPKLEPAQFTDPAKGVWELHGMDSEWLSQKNIRARDPALDVRECNVAIDFGTSSTVVAYDEHDQYKLLRIGVSSYWDKECPEHYENPTMLAFKDFQSMLGDWQQQAYRPNLLWDDVCCSHEAQQQLRDSQGDPRVAASIMAKLKHWALREGSMPRLPLLDRTDHGGHEHLLATLSIRNPVRGTPLQVSELDPFDPIELYAWFLGMNINWRGRGLFLKYYMTFPVNYPRDTKDKILSSFRRGLQRSLPAGLTSSPIFDRFSVEERASEPAAYAAGAMKNLGIKPSIKGTPYAVFDFGGGTTDFDYGLYRLPTVEEEDEGKEEVFEHFDSAGDRFLGGENLLEHLAYLTFRHNLDVCREHRISFTRPMDADDFAGSEMFLEPTQTASTNTLMLMACLRQFWESDGPINGTGMETLDLLDREGKKTSHQLKIPTEELEAFLARRITQGISNFLTAMDKAFAKEHPEQIHIILAGNASRSRWVTKAFERLKTEESAPAVSDTPASSINSPVQFLLSRNGQSLIVYSPLHINAENPYAPTAKTGVALGLLRLCPGSPVKVINRAECFSGNEAPFAHYIGRLRQGVFQTAIAQGSEYDVWHELGAPSEGVFNLYHTQSPRAHAAELRQGENGLFKHRLELSGDLRGQRIFARIIGPSSIETCTSISLDEIKKDALENLITLDLDK